MESSKTKPKLEYIPIVYEYPDVFPDESPGQPPEREVYFSIEFSTWNRTHSQGL